MNRLSQERLFAVILMLLSSCAAAQNRASTASVLVVTAEHQGSDLRVEVTLDSPVNPEVGRAVDPDRILIDLPGTTCNACTQNVSVNANGIRRVRIGQHSTSPMVTRVVVDLDQTRPYTVKTQGNRVILTVGPAENAGSVSQRAPAAAASGNLIGVFHPKNREAASPKVEENIASTPIPAGRVSEPPRANSSPSLPTPPPTVAPTQPASVPAQTAEQAPSGQNQVAAANSTSNSAGAAIANAPPESAPTVTSAKVETDAAPAPAVRTTPVPTAAAVSQPTDTVVVSPDMPDVGPHPLAQEEHMESHVGNLTGHSKEAKSDYRRYCAGCHGERGDGNGENATWLDPKPRDFTLATFKCRSTPTGTLPTDEDLYNTIERGLTNSYMPTWNTFSRQQRVDLVAYIKTLSPRWEKEKPGDPIKIPAEPPVTIESISHGKALFTKMECWKCHGTQGKGDGPSAPTLTDSKDQPIRPYDFGSGKDDSRFKCGSTNADLYRIFMTGLDGTPMPSFADNIQPNDAWDLVHFLRTLQVHRHSKENEVLKAAGGKIPAYAEKQSEAPASQPSRGAEGGGK